MRFLSWERPFALSHFLHQINDTRMESWDDGTETRSIKSKRMSELVISFIRLTVTVRRFYGHREWIFKISIYRPSVIPVHRRNKKPINLNDTVIIPSHLFSSLPANYNSRPVRQVVPSSRHLFMSQTYKFCFLFFSLPKLFLLVRFA